MPNEIAVSARSFVLTLGIDTHIDFGQYGYQNLAITESAINYLGVKNIRDSAATSMDAQTWLQVAQATGAKFDDFIGEASPGQMQVELGYIKQLASEGILNYIEGGNEEDDPYAANLGNTLAITAQFQQQVYAIGQQAGLPVINMSFGAGWTAANNWHGDYDKVGNLSAYANYANAHTYPNPGQTPDSTIQQLNSDALLAAAGRPIMTTEIGWDGNTFSQGAVAQYVVQAALDGMKDGDVKMYYYALFNDGSGNFGLMNSNGTPLPAGTALHDLTTLLADTGANAASFTPGSLNYTLSGTQGGDNTLLMQKSDGSDWLAVWNESAGTHTVTLDLANTATQIMVFDPVTGTSSIKSASNSNSISVTLGNDPLLIEVVPAGASASTSGTGSSTGTATNTGTSGPSGSSSSGTTGTTGGSSPDPVLTVPASEKVAAGAGVAISGVAVADPWAATNPGTLALNVWDQSGTLKINGQTFGPGGGPVAGGMFSGSLAQINADLAALSYTAGANAGSDTITVDVWDQAGVEVKKTIPVTVTAAPATGSTSTAGTHNDLAVTVPASDTVAPGGKAAISGVSVSDPWAAGNPGAMALNVWDQSGTLTIDGKTFGPAGDQWLAACSPARSPRSTPTSPPCPTPPARTADRTRSSSMCGIRLASRSKGPFR